jgi:hypothetical protein
VEATQDWHSDWDIFMVLSPTHLNEFSVSNINLVESLNSQGAPESYSTGFPLNKKISVH